MPLWSFGLTERRESFRFQTPSSLLVVGSSGCGKTGFTTKLLLNNLALFHTPPSQIRYCYRGWQDGFQPMKEQGIKFHEGVPDTDQLKTCFPKGRLLVLDNLMAKGGNGKRVLDLFTKHSHHRTSQCSTCAKTCFRQGNMPRVFPETSTTSLHSRIHEIN